MVTSHAWRCTTRLQRCQIVSRLPSPSLWTHGNRHLSTFVPTKPSTAGSSVTAAATVTATTAAAPIPNPLMNDRPIANMPSNAMITVSPANSTARPDVSIAVMTASSGSRPACSPWR